MNHVKVASHRQWHKLDGTADDVSVNLYIQGLIQGGWQQEDSLVCLIECQHDEQNGPRGAEEEGDDGHEADLGKGRGEREGEDIVCYSRVLDRCLQADCNDLGPT